MARDEEVSLSVPGVLESLGLVARFVTGVATTAGLDKEALYRLRLAVDEIATNVVVHGYGKARQQGDLGLHSRIEGHTLVVSLFDTAPPFDPTQARAPDVNMPLEERPIGGLGDFLAIISVDELLYDRVGARNRTTFKMRLGGQAAGDQD